MFITPLLKPLKTKGGTLYVFPSASKDIAKTFTDDDFRFVFDRFALLNLPDVKTPVNYSNDIVWENIGAMPNTSSIPVPPGLNASESFNIALALQNYCFNFESLILSGQNNLAIPYNENLKKTPSERVFFKFLKEINAIRFDDSVLESNVNDRYIERQKINDTYYNKVVQYVGDIDLINNVNRDGQSYSEIYIHVANSVGSTPEILFKTISDDNYFANGNWIGSDEFISGRSSSTIHPSGFDLNAWYDDDSSNSYNSSSVFNDSSDTLKVVNLSGSLSTKNVKISNLDGIGIDFDLANYKRATDNGYISFEELNRTSSSGDFQFNVILLYYSIYSVTNPSNSERNLYGVLFLDDFVNTLTSGSYIPRIEKIKPNQITGTSGNSFGLKLNIKFDPYSETIGSEVTINEYSTFSMDLFADLMTILQDANIRFSETLAKNEMLFNELNNLKDSLFTSSTTELQNQINELQRQLQNSNLAINSNTFAVDLISQLSKRIDDILTGKTAITPNLDLGFLDFGRGIKLDYSVPNKIKVINSLENFSKPCVCRNSSGDIDYSFDNGIDFLNTLNGNVIIIGNSSSRFSSKSITDINFTDDLILNLEEPAEGWLLGQTFRLVFNYNIYLNGFSIQAYTDFQNKFQNNNKYQKLVFSINETDLISSKPIIEVICIDPFDYVFEIDILR